MSRMHRACLFAVAMLACCVAFAPSNAGAAFNTISVGMHITRLPSPHFEPLLRSQPPHPQTDQKRKKRPRPRIKAR